MDTTRWENGFPAGQTDTDRPTAQQPGAEPDGLQGYGPDPENPFDEPEAAPELQRERSESLYSRNTPFWERVVELPAEGEEYPQDPGYWDHPDEIRENVIMRVREEKLAEWVWKRLSSRTALYVYGITLLVVGLVLLSVSLLTTVRSINVVGNTRFTREEVIALSGLEVGMNSIGIDEDVVTARIERERYLRCTLVDVATDCVTLHVSERVPAATIVQNGRRVILDESGWVLELSDDMYTVPAGLVDVIGLDAQHCNLGQRVDLRVPERLLTYMQILVELRAMGGLYLITELDMTTMDSITLKLKDGTTVHLGNEEAVHEKIRALLVVRDNLIRNDYYDSQPGGTIVVSDPTSPAYMPPEA